MTYKESCRNGFWLPYMSSLKRTLRGSAPSIRTKPVLVYVLPCQAPVPGSSPGAWESVILFTQHDDLSLASYIAFHQALLMRSQHAKPPPRR